MNELLSQMYGTKEKVAAAAQQAAEQTQTDAFEVELNEAVVAEIEKTAAAQGIDLDSLTDEQLGEVVQYYKGEFLKQASAGAEGAAEDAGNELGIDPAVLSEADMVGRTIAHAFVDEWQQIQQHAAGVEKTAGMSDEEILDALANARANAILEALEGNPENFVKEAALGELDEEIDDLVTLRAAEMLDEAGYDVDAIVASLDDQA